MQVSFGKFVEFMLLSFILMMPIALKGMERVNNLQDIYQSHCLNPSDINDDTNCVGWEGGDDVYLEDYSAYSAKRQNPEIHVFIHVCTLNHWQAILERQLMRLKSSGLYDACTSISLGVLGKGDVAPYKNIYPKLQILFQNPDTALYERPTLLKLHELSVSNPAHATVLYLHTKGITRGANSEYIADWVNLMEYFVIDRWKDCILALQEHDVCGVNWRNVPLLHFSGNFWWATTRYAATLPAFISAGYYDPEMWIGLNFPNCKCFHESGVDHYYHLYPESKYVLLGNHALEGCSAQ